MKKLIFFVLMVLAVQVHAQSNAGKSAAIEAIGGSGGMLLYDAYLVIGEAADAYVSGNYTADVVNKIVNEQFGGIGAVQDQYKALLKSDFLRDASDREFLQQLIDALDLVLNQGKALLEYVESGDDEDAVVFEERRQAAWKEVSELLGFDE